MHAEAFLGPRAAARYLQLHLVGFMIGRFAGSALMKSIRASRLLAFFAFGALLCAVVATSTSGAIPIYAVVLIGDRKSTRLNSSHGYISYAVFCLKNKKYVEP